jgi:transforming growth factor-beta-induced protein
MRVISSIVAAALLALVAVVPASAANRGPTIVDVAISVNSSSGEFDHLIAAAARADLVATLDGRRQFTVFAPTDAAFEDLFDVLGVASVNDIPLDTLRAVLLYHVAPGERFAGDVLSADRIRTLQRGFLNPSSIGGTAYVNGATILAADIDASNGVIHVIDAVLLPS